MASDSDKIFINPTRGETIVVVLVVLWLLGFVTSYTMGGLIHVLLVMSW